VTNTTSLNVCVVKVSVKSARWSYESSQPMQRLHCFNSGIKRNWHMCPIYYCKVQKKVIMCYLKTAVLNPRSSILVLMYVIFKVIVTHIFVYANFFFSAVSWIYWLCQWNSNFQDELLPLIEDSRETTVAV